VILPFAAMHLETRSDWPDFQGDTKMRMGRKRNRFKLIMAMAVSAMAIMTPAQGQGGHRQTFNIDADDLGEALKSVSRQSGREIIFSAEAVKNKTAPHLKGAYTADEAVTALLSGSDLTAEFRKDVVFIRGRSEAPGQISESSAVAPDIVITGSYIRGAQATSPVMRATRSEIQREGLTDLVLGNIGKNFYLRPTPGMPVRLWLNDFDQNGQREQLITYTVNDQDVPVFTKKEITDQFPSLKKQHLRHDAYAGKTITDLFGEAIVHSSASRSFDYNASIIAINKGGGHFEITELPLMAQLSSVNALLIADVDGNGSNDLLVAGNMFGFPPQFGRLDANYGLVLLNDGKANFTLFAPAAASLHMRGAVKDMSLVKTDQGLLLLAAINNEKPQKKLFRIGQINESGS